MIADWRRDVGQMKRIDILPDDVLLRIFDFYVDMGRLYVKKEIEEWQTLVHVCRRWRGLVLGSPRRLNLRLWCTPISKITYFFRTFWHF